MIPRVSIVGAGLAGSEAAWQLASRGIAVTLHEMKPDVYSPAHQNPDFAELVCSNSFGALGPTSASGMLKAEMSALGSLILSQARRHEVAAGGSLAVDRQAFSRGVTEALSTHPLIDIVRGEVPLIPAERPVIIATGPLTGSGLAADIQKRVGQTSLYFYDAIAPVVLGESINRDIAFMASRYSDEPGDYLNCPMDKAQYEAFVAALLGGDCYPPHPFEEEKLFHGCQPIEAIAASGPMTLSFGPMRPVGLTDPRTGKRPWAVVQLRREDRDGQMWNLVGFQTKLRHGEQARILRTIPGLEAAEFIRFGTIHRNTFLNAPTLLNERLALRDEPRLHFAGQITGVEGYLESTACGLMCALFVWGELTGNPVEAPPPESMLGALLRYLREADAKNFQPMNTNFGILPPMEHRPRTSKSDRRDALAARGADAFHRWSTLIPSLPTQPV